MKNTTSLKYTTAVVNPADPTQSATAEFVSPFLHVSANGAWDTVWWQIGVPVIGLHKKFKANRLGLKFLGFAESHEKYGTDRVLEMWLWEKLPQKVRLAWCILREHAWHAEDDGDAENGPQPPHIHCLRCGCVDMQIGSDVVDVVVHELDYGNVRQGHLVMLHPADDDDSIWPVMPWGLEEEED